MNKEELDSIKSIELEMLRAFIPCCECLGIRYYLLGGTLLGAIRHNGFIPWDDDIDVGLFRSDYERFITEGQKYIPEYYFIQSLCSEPKQPFNFAKIRDSRTTFIETSYKNAKINHGIYIDVFPLDYYPMDSTTQQNFNRKKKWLDLRIRKEIVISDNNKEPIVRRLYRDFMGCLATLKYPKVEDAIIERESLYKSFNKSEMIANFSGAWGEKEIVPIEWYGKGTKAKFEGLTVTIPTEYEKWLTKVYGDYMKLPPPEQRIPHHYTEVIDVHNSYKEYGY